MRVLLIAAAVAAMPVAAMGFEMTDSAFEVHHLVNGEDVAEATTTVPLSTDDTCWYWYIRSAELTGEVEFVEKLLMPVAPASWGDTTQDEEEVEPFRTEDDGRIGISHRKVALSDGWFGHGWCFLPGDPVGPHRIEVTIDDTMVKSFDFTVVPAPPSKSKTVPPKRTDRSGRLLNKG